MPDKKVINLALYKDAELQRTPQEVLELLQDEIDKGVLTHMLVVYRDDKEITFVPGAYDRQYTYKNIYWDFFQWAKSFFLDR